MPNLPSDVPKRVDAHGVPVLLVRHETSPEDIGSANKKPWTDEHPWARSSISWAVSSTPSAVVSIPSALASSVIACTIAIAPSRVSRFWMKLRSIFSLSNGKLCK